MDKKNARKARQRKLRNRRIALTLCLMLTVAVASIGGTIAWLTDKTAEVKNTFTPAGIEIDLIETMNKDTNDDGEADAWEAQLIPGKEYMKDPVVSVNGDVTDVDVYLFVKFEEKKNPFTYLKYTSLLKQGEGWTLVEGQTNVWYREVKTTDTAKAWHLLKDDKVTVKSELTETQTQTDGIEMVYTAYAIQTKGFETPALAWAEVSNLA